MSDVLDLLEKPIQSAWGNFAEFIRYSSVAARIEVSPGFGAESYEIHLSMDRRIDIEIVGSRQVNVLKTLVNLNTFESTVEVLDNIAFYGAWLDRRSLCAVKKYSIPSSEFEALARMRQINKFKTPRMQQIAPFRTLPVSMMSSRYRGRGESAKNIRAAILKGDSFGIKFKTGVYAGHWIDVFPERSKFYPETLVSYYADDDIDMGIDQLVTLAIWHNWLDGVAETGDFEFIGISSE